MYICLFWMYIITLHIISFLSSQMNVYYKECLNADIFELRRKIGRHDCSSQSYIQLKRLWNYSLKSWEALNKYLLQDFIADFSNSLIIHQVKIKKTTSAKEVWIPGLWLLCLLLSFCFNWEDISNTQDSISSAIQHLEFHHKYSAAHHIFNSLLDVWISWWNTVSCVWYITP